jgi:hypothetical protein
MKSFLGRSPGSSRWRLAVSAGVAVSLIAAGIALGVYLASSGSESPAAAPTLTPAAVASPSVSPTPAVTPEATPAPTSPPTIAEFTPAPLGCPDCPVKAGDQLKVTAKDIQIGSDGKYYVPDRGDGCAYEQDLSTDWGLVLRAPGCEAFWIQVAEQGEVAPVIP